MEKRHTRPPSQPAAPVMRTTDLVGAADMLVWQGSCNYKRFSTRGCVTNRPLSPLSSYKGSARDAQPSQRTLIRALPRLHSTEPGAAAPTGCDCRIYPGPDVCVLLGAAHASPSYCSEYPEATPSLPKGKTFLDRDDFDAVRELFPLGWGKDWARSTSRSSGATGCVSCSSSP